MGSNPVSTDLGELRMLFCFVSFRFVRIALFVLGCGVVWCGIPSLRSIKTRAHSFVIRVTISARYDDGEGGDFAGLVPTLVMEG